MPTDIVRHKQTLPVLYAFEHATPAEHARLTQLYKTDDLDEAEVAEVVAILERAGAAAFTRSEAQRHRDQCLTELDGLSVIGPKAHEKLTGIIRAVIAA